MKVVDAFTTPPDLTPSTSSLSAFRFSGLSSSALEPSSERIFPPAALETSMKSQVSPS